LALILCLAQLLGLAPVVLPWAVAAWVGVAAAVAALVAAAAVVVALAPLAAAQCLYPSAAHPEVMPQTSLPPWAC
jgi:hypothetical protein